MLKKFKFIKQYAKSPTVPGECISDTLLSHESTGEKL